MNACDLVSHAIIIHSLHTKECCYVRQDGRSALHIAAENGHIEAITFLLDHGCNINARGNVRHPNDLYDKPNCCTLDFG